MAWQLIYTSAPRSLAAGRSGFGTVARHRALSPMLVSAIERVSQFSRQPGENTDRIIYAHRRIDLAGGRFHVLSAIRDAGADYTGRTNHIAHHLIAEAREIAQLGSHGPSPADVLLAYRWLHEWTDPPHYFEDEGVPLAEIARGAGAQGSAWERVTGSATQAWLLATGEALRGAYVIQPHAAELREIYQESLVHVAEPWKMNFTTSLQPSDEPADFRWIGLEPTSPLRAQAATSGRLMVDLSRPDSLPLAVAPMSAASAPQPSGVTYAETAIPPEESASEAATPPLEQPVAEVVPSAPRRSGPRHLQGPPSAELKVAQKAVKPPRQPWRFHIPRGRRTLLVIAGAVVLLAFSAAFLFLHWLPKQAHEKAVQEVIAKFRDKSFFPAAARSRIAETLVKGPDTSVGFQLIELANQVTKLLEEGNLAELESPEAGKVLATLDSLSLPVELGLVSKVAYQALDIARPLKALASTKDVKELSDALSGPRHVLEELKTKNSNLPKLVEALQGEMDRRMADRLLAMATNKAGPVEGSSFRDAVNAIVPPYVADVSARATLAKVQSIINQPRPAAPEPTTVETVANPPARPKPPQPKVAVLPTLPIYFVIGKNVLRELAIKELNPALKCSWRLGLEGAFEDFQSGKLRRYFGDPDADFEIVPAASGGAFSFVPYRGAPAFMPPFSLRGKDDKGGELFQVWVLADAKAPFPKRTGGLTKTKTGFQLDLAALELPGRPQGMLQLEVPAAYTVAGMKLKREVSGEGTIDFADSVNQLQKEIAGAKADIGKLEKTLTVPAPNPGENFVPAKNEVLQGISVEGEAGKLVAASNSRVEQCVGAISLASKHARAKAFDDLAKFSGPIAGKAIAADKEEGILKQAHSLVIEARSSLEGEVKRANDEAFRAKSENEKKAAKEHQAEADGHKQKYSLVLKAMERMVMALLPEEPAIKVARDKAIADAKAEIEKQTKALHGLENHALFLKTVLPGVYRLSVAYPRVPETVLLDIEPAP